MKLFFEYCDKEPDPDVPHRGHKNNRRSTGYGYGELSRIGPPQGLLVFQPVRVCGQFGLAQR
jgi:hypothetical protein